MAFTLPSKTDFTKIQNQIMNAIRGRSIAIIGGPGTGKTVLAIHAINDLIMRGYGERSMLIVYSKPLQCFIKETLRNKNGNHEISATWHSWFFNYLMKVLNCSWNKVKELQIRDFVYDWNKVHEELEKVSDEDLMLYDYFFIDEAQDLPDELLKIISKAARRIYAFFDDNQMVNINDRELTYNTQSNILTILGLEERFYDLIENFRNTKQIEKVAKLYMERYNVNGVTLKGFTSTREGKKPVLLETDGNLEVIAKYIVKEIKDNPSSSIGVLIPSLSENYREVFEKYRDLFKKECPKGLFHYYFSDDSNVKPEDFNKPGIFLMSYKTSKGLEFDSVYLIELNNKYVSFLSRLDLNAFYVSITRARNNLYFIYDKSLNDSKVIEIAKENLDLFTTIRLTQDILKPEKLKFY